VRYDCVVVGAGLAGMTAAVRIAESGRRCVVLAKGVGSLYLGGATIDFLGYSRGPVANPRAELSAFRDANPGHPYNHVSDSHIEQSIDWLKGRAEGLVGDLSENMLIPTALGVPKPSGVVPESIATGDMRSGGRILLVGFGSLKDFYPRLAADNLQASLGDVTAHGVEIDVAPDNEPDVTGIRYGRAFDDAEFRKEVIRALGDRLDGAERVGFPAVLGVRDAHTVWVEVQDALGLPVFEIPTLPPSIPGIRIFEHLKKRLRSAGGRLILNNTVVGAGTSSKRVRELVADSGSGRVVCETNAVVLATGGVASGGIVMDSSWKVSEPTLDLPVAGVPEAANRRFDPDYFEDQPVSGAGVATDELLRPVDATGAVVYENVFVAGATLAGGRPWHEKSGNGISLATGWAAAGHVVEGGDTWN
jgi:glycerol-3-phosphate dehydrogenase subunit B